MVCVSALFAKTSSILARICKSCSVHDKSPHVEWALLTLEPVARCASFDVAIGLPRVRTELVVCRCRHDSGDREGLLVRRSTRGHCQGNRTEDIVTIEALCDLGTALPVVMTNRTSVSVLSHLNSCMSFMTKDKALYYSKCFSDLIVGSTGPQCTQWRDCFRRDGYATRTAPLPLMLCPPIKYFIS